MKSYSKIKNVVDICKHVWRQETPGQLVIQFTDRCNALCPQCGMRATAQFKRSTLALDNVRRILDAAAEKGVKVVSFTGGEPLLYARELAGLIRYAGDAGIEFIRTGTNGFIFTKPEQPDFQSRVQRIADTLADTPVRNFWISIDSAIPETHEKMRGLPGVIKGIEKALPVFMERGLYPSANLGINRNIARDTVKTVCDAQDSRKNRDKRDLESFYSAFRNGFNEFYRFVIDMGFTMVNSCYPMSINGGPEQEGLNPVYAATSEEDLVRFAHPEKRMLYKAAMDVIPEYRSQIRIFSPRASLYAMYQYYGNGREKPYPCRGGLDYFFIDSKTGRTYPCGYRGHEDLGWFWEMKRNGHQPASQCFQCDWECFRDPSELFGPFLHLVSDWPDFIEKYKSDRPYFRIWAEDLRYYIACGFFNGREPVDYKKLSKFSAIRH